MLRPGTRIDRYEILSAIGSGGMATVYAARHLELGSLHGIKVMSLTSPALVTRVLQEGRIQAGLRHPNVVSVTDVLRIQGVPALVMDLVVGPSLETLIGARRLDLDQVDHLARGILAGVGAAHSQGRVHRDIKPGNVLLELTHEGVLPRVADFGLAKITGSDSMSRSRTGVVMGTPAFMAPEQFRNAKGVGPAADVFSLGVLIYQMLTSELPFPGNDMISIFRAIEAQEVVPPRALVPELPEPLNDALLAALRFDAQARPQTALELGALWMAPGPGPLSPFSKDEIKGLRSMGVRLSGSIPPLDSADSDPGSGDKASQSDLVDLAEGALWPTRLGRSVESVPPSERTVPPGSAQPQAAPAVSMPPADPPEEAGWGPWVLIGLVLVGTATWILGGERLTSGMEGGEGEVSTEQLQADAEPVEPEVQAESPAVVQVKEPPAEPPAVPPVAPPTAILTERVGPAPAAKPELEPEPAPPPPKARVRVDGVKRAYAVDSAGKQHGLEGLAPGRYVIYAFFESARATKVLELSLVEGQQVSLSCVPAMRMCKPA